MLKSMTGFGRGEGDTSLGKVFVESRSINHRYCDINLKLPKRLAPFEIRIKEILRSQVSRGRIDVSLKLDTTEGEKIQLNVDTYLAEQYFRALQLLKERLQLKGDITLELLAGTKDLITVKEGQEDIESFWSEIVPILKLAFQDMDHMKRLEGESLAKDIQLRLERVSQQLENIKQRSSSCIEGYQNRLYEKIRFLLKGIEVDDSRFYQEVTFLAERIDITEEMVRAESHLGRFSTLLKGEEPVGRKLDFLLQEINREVNTISAKANDAEISQRVVEIKCELEKIREQVQNIE